MGKGNFNIEEEVEKTLLALDDFEHVEASPYFYSRLSQKLEPTSSKPPAQQNFIWTRLWRPKMLLILLGVSIFSSIQIDNTFNIWCLMI